PLDLYSAGFQLSFLAVIALAMLMPRLKEFWLSQRDPHAVAAEGLVQPSALHAALSRVIAFVIQSVEFMTIIWLATLPLVAMQFGQINPWTIPFAVALLPIVFVAL